MIYVTGDTHGELDIDKLNMKNFPQQREMNKHDLVIIAGDFGCIWSGGKRDEYWLDWLESRNFTTLWIDGNHENFSLINQYPVTEWKGGKVHQIRPSVIHLMRGQVFNIDGQTFFAFGGALSIDKHYRKEFISWWSEEIPNNREIEEGLRNLEKHNMTVDYVITHTAPDTIIEQLHLDPLYLEGEKINDPTCKILTHFMENIEFKKWYFGHFHLDKKIGKFTTIYDKIEKIEDGTTVSKREKRVYVDIICATKDCPRNLKCKRYAAYLYLIDNDIQGDTCTLFSYKNCSKFIPLEGD